MPLTENPTLVQVVDEMERLNNLIVDRGGARTITPNTSNQVLSKGNYKGDITIIGDGDLQPHNIKKGVNIFGVNGSLIEGKRWAKGSCYVSNDKMNFYAQNGASYSLAYITISSLGFIPKHIIYVASSRGTRFGFVSDIGQYYATSGLYTLQGSEYSMSYISGGSYNIKIDSGSSIKIPTGGNDEFGKPYNWIAFE